MSGRAQGARAFLAGILSLLPLAAILIVTLALRPRLGPKMASHWSAGNAYPDGFSSTWGSFAVFAAIVAALSIAAVVAVILAARRRVSRVFPAVAALIAGVSACGWIAIAWANAAAATPATARLGPRFAIMLVGAVCGALIYLLLPPTVLPPSDDARRPVLPLAGDERVAWSGVIRSRVLDVAVVIIGAMFVGAIVLAVALGEPSVWITAVVLGLATLSCLMLVPVRLTIDQRGIRLVSVVLRVPLIRVRLENIEAVTADTIDPLQWGGWGFRISGAGLAYVTRRGPGLVVTRRSGGAVAITIADPERPAAVANALIAKVGPGAAPG